jgi:hypothetical protein
MRAPPAETVVDQRVGLLERGERGKVVVTRQAYVRERDRLVDHGARDRDRPEFGAKVGVERDQRAGVARSAHRCEAGRARRLGDGERDARDVEDTRRGDGLAR